MTGPARYAATLVHDRVNAAVGEAVWREGPSRLWYWAALAVVLFFAVQWGHLLAFMAVQYLPFSVMFSIGPQLPPAIAAIVAVLAFIVVTFVYERAVQRSLKIMLARLDVPASVEAVFEVLDEGLRVDTGRAVLLYRWAAIGDIVKVTGGWVVRGDTSAMFVPSADFAQDSDERAFIGAVLARLTDKARARSADARAFAGGDQVPISA